MIDLSQAERTRLDAPDRLAVVAELSQTSRGSTLVLDSMARLAADIGNTPIALISLVDDGRQRFIGTHGTDMRSTTRDVSLCARVVASTTDLVVKNALEHDTFSTNPLVRGSFNLRAYAGVPLLFAGQYIGAVCVIDHNPRVFDDDCVRRLYTLGASVTAFLERQRSTDRPMPEAGEHFHEQALNATGQAVLITDLDNRVIWANASTQQMFATRSPIGLLLSQVISDPKPADDRVESRHITERVTPLIDPALGQVTGTIHTFTDSTMGEDQRLRLERLVNTEWLTGVDSRRSFETQLKHEIELFGKGAPTGPVAVGILDLDHFKAVNDELGHAAGDEVLVEVAERIRERVDGLGTVARLGGDEFGLLLHDSDPAVASGIAREILQDIHHAMKSHDDVRRHLSASVGLAILRRTDRSPGDVLLRADIACYEAKKAGGGRVRVEPGFV